MTKSVAAVWCIFASMSLGCADRKTGSTPLADGISGEESDRVPQRPGPTQVAAGDEVDGTFIWDRQERPYVIIEVKHKSFVGVEHRYVRAVVPSPDTKAEVESAAKEIYEQLKADIDSVRPDARYKRINLLIYDSFADAKEYDGYHILHVATEAAPIIPLWKDVTTSWSWRDPQHRPASGQLSIFHDYWSTIYELRSKVEDEYRDKDGVVRANAADQCEIERRVANERRKHVNKLLKLHGLDEMEFARQLAIVQVWRNGDVPTEEAVATWTELMRNEWSPQQ